MNSDYILTKIIEIFLCFYIVYMVNYLLQHFVIRYRKNWDKPASKFEITLSYLKCFFVFGIIALIIIYYPDNDNEHKQILHINLGLIVFLSLTIISLYSIYTAFFNHNKLTNEERIKLRFKIYKKDEKSIDFLFGISQYKQENYSSALEIFNRIIRKGIESEAYYWRGMCLASFGRHNEAINDFNIALILFPDNSDILFRLSVSKGEIGDKKGEAIDFIEAFRLSKK